MDTDFTNEANIKRFVKPNRWLSLDFKGCRLLRLNWVTTLISSIVMWSFIIWSFIKKEEASVEILEWKSWLSINFTWFYILTRNVWLIFIGGLLFTKYKHIKLGKDDEKPHFSDLSWFAMLFSCGTGVSMFTYGVAEPMWFYRYNAHASKIPFVNDDQRAQMAMMMSNYQTGLHGWVPYVIVGLLLGITTYRQGRPMSMRYAFQPILGKNVNGFIGDIIDSVTIACTTFGVCTSLGLGTGAIGSALNRINSNIEPTTLSTKLWIIWSITGIASISVLTGIKNGIRNLAKMALFSGITLALTLICSDNPGFLFNSFVQTTGHYLQWLTVLGFNTDTWASFTGQLTDSGNWERLTLGNTRETSVTAMSTFDHTRLDQELMDSSWGERSPYNFMDMWTVFYWAWGAVWAPFVGSFIARISRGRTVGEVIKAALFTTTFFLFFNRNIFGSLGIKMQRTAEYALGANADIDWVDGSVNCTALGYTNRQPVSEAAIQLANEGYYALSCRAFTDQILDIMEPYTGLTKWLQSLVLVSVLLYFTTSSDSGSYVDDLIASQGFLNPPPIQKIYWAVTEGALTHALVVNGGIDVLKGATIVSAFPFTIILCLLCVSLWRVLKMETGDPTITNARKSFNTGIFDVLDGFKHEDTDPVTPSRKKCIQELVAGVIFPFRGIKSVSGSNVTASVSMFVYVTWIVLLSISGVANGAHAMAWVMYIFFVSIVAKIRMDLRHERGVYGNPVEDFVTSLTLYPLAIAQMVHESETGDKIA
jgi:choline-glycine betaine transporter